MIDLEKFEGAVITLEDTGIEEDFPECVDRVLKFLGAETSAEVVGISTEEELDGFEELEKFVVSGEKETLFEGIDGVAEFFRGFKTEKGNFVHECEDGGLYAVWWKK
jgi:hypothetical protein